MADRLMMEGPVLIDMEALQTNYKNALLCILSEQKSVQPENDECSQ